MKSVRLGKSGLRVSELALGTWRFGRDTDESASFAQLDLFRDRGGNFIDTADVYGNGLAEEIVGRWLASRGGRGELVIGTKVWGRTGEGPNALGLSRKHILSAIDASLRRLQTDHVDLFYVHAWTQEFASRRPSPRWTGSFARARSSTSERRTGLAGSSCTRGGSLGSMAGRSSYASRTSTTCFPGCVTWRCCPFAARQDSCYRPGVLWVAAG